ncbi:MAG: YkgJ family cysteine cluster protein [Methanomicrobiales archaeon]|nr:YkgJ family cysteine cluster protein [Methanomicrobiales archaeon]MDI6876342.1 YkgJ family cysteine cluster protein [Methanomicrobiales archaeon]
MDSPDEGLPSRICEACGGRCCHGAHPPLTPERIGILEDLMRSADGIESGSYARLRVREDGFCILMEGNRCIVHAVKPETCAAGPFTFDIRDGVLEIYLKKETICPLVRHLKQDSGAYRRQILLAVENITRLIRLLPPDQLAAVLRIDEPETDKVACLPLYSGGCA